MAYKDDPVAWHRDYHARRMLEDPEYREARLGYSRAAAAKLRLKRENDTEAKEKYLEHERKRHAKRILDPEYVEKKRTRAREHARQRFIDFPDLVRAEKRRAQNTRRARKLDQFIEEVDHEIVYKMHGGMCGICKQFIEGAFHVDHIIPLSKGGMHGYINVQPAHPFCNQSKGNRVPA